MMPLSPSMLLSIAILGMIAHSLPFLPASCRRNSPLAGSHLSRGAVSLNSGGPISDGDFVLSIDGNDVPEGKTFSFPAGKPLSISLSARGDKPFKGFLIRLEDLTGTDTSDTLRNADDLNVLIVPICMAYDVGGLGHNHNLEKTMVTGELEYPEASSTITVEVTVVVNNNDMHGTEWYHSQFALSADEIEPPSPNATTSPATAFPTTSPSESPTESALTSSPTAASSSYPSSLPTSLSTASPVSSATRSPSASPTRSITTSPTATSAPTSMTDSETPQPADSLVTSSPTDAPATASPADATVVVTPSPLSSSPADDSAMETSAPSTSVSPSTGLRTESHAAAQTAAPTSSSSITDLHLPRLVWFTKLQSSESTPSSLGRKNAVTVSPDGGLVYITRDDGTLDVLNANDGSLRFRHTPEPLAPDFYPVTCRSGVFFAESNVLGKFAVYSIIDTPSFQGVEATSRIVAVSHPNNRVLFTSETVLGHAQGTPVVTMHPVRPGKFIFITHNTLSALHTPEGFLSIFHAEDNGALIFTEGDSAQSPLNASLTFGPPEIVATPTPGGNFEGAFSNPTDVVVWTTSDGDGLGGTGLTRAVQLPVIFDDTVASLLKTSILRQVGWNAVSAPTLSKDGQSMYAVIGGGGALGWVGNQTFNDRSSWFAMLTPETLGKSVQNSVTLSNSGNRLYISGVGNSLDCLSSSGEKIWSTNVSGAFAGEVKVSPDDRSVYSVLQDGSIIAMDQLTGDVFWTIGFCTIVPLACDGVGRIQAEFSVSPNGLIQYVGSVDGTVAALRLGFSSTPTVAPSDYPTPFPSLDPLSTEEPTVVFSHIPSIEPSMMPSSVASGVPSAISTDVPTTVPTTVEPTQEESLLHQFPIMSTSDHPSFTASQEPSSFPSSIPTYSTITWTPIETSSCLAQGFGPLNLIVVLVVACVTWMAFH